MRLILDGLIVLGLALAALFASGCDMSVGCMPPEEIPEDTVSNLHVLSYNIGNSDMGNERYALRMKLRSYEDHVGARIRELEPDIVALQEVLPPTACAGFEETNPSYACFGGDDAAPQARRILGPDYTIVCDERRHVECVGVHVDFGTVEGVEPGAFSLDGAATAPLPLPAAAYKSFEGDDAYCDAESAISSLTIDTDAGPIAVIHAHPTAVGNECRQHQLRQAFELADDTPTILVGDWNFDPSKTVAIIEAGIWFGHVGEDNRFQDHSPVGGDCCGKRTSANRDASLDRVVSDFALGACDVMRSPRLDDGFDFDAAGERVARIDHYAVSCELHDPR